MSPAEVLQMRQLIHQWLGHGKLTVVVDDDEVYLKAADVERLAGIPPWGRGETLLLDDGALVTMNGADFYPLPAALDRARIEDTDLSREFLAWLEAELPALTASDILDAAHRVVPFTVAVTVDRAARILNDDPMITIGRNGLFEHMAALGWIERNDPTHDWVITPEAHRADYLTLRAVSVGAATKTGRRRYMQVHVSVAGLTELRRTLAGIGRAAPPNPDPTPTLFD
ncbi:MAG: hypothetical protein J0H96_11745 [Microbacterium ginsengisoli]|jgi:hypothetical protein|nr:hypothetical protein [Microbacterium ginsengisoli]